MKKAKKTVFALSLRGSGCCHKKFLLSYLTGLVNWRVMDRLKASKRDAELKANFWKEAKAAGDDKIVAHKNRVRLNATSIFPFVSMLFYRIRLALENLTISSAT